MDGLPWILGGANLRPSGVRSLAGVRLIGIDGGFARAGDDDLQHLVLVVFLT